jgi:cell division transport system ATP-binding protein
MVELHNVTMKYATGDGIERITLNVAPGEFVFLVGPSGAGKSTVLKMIYMDEWPDEGHVIVNGYSSLYTRPKDIPYLRRKLGVVFQDFKLLLDRNVFENVAFALRVTNTKRKVIKKQVLRVLANVGLSHKRNKLPLELSGGEQQRVAIARALVNEPFILLADEPTGNLDPEVSEGIMELLERINERGTAVLMATHNYPLVEKHRGRIIRIDRGRII